MICIELDCSLLDIAIVDEEMRSIPARSGLLMLLSLIQRRHLTNSDMMACFTK